MYEIKDIKGIHKFKVKIGENSLYEKRNTNYNLPK